jgi:agmatine/peptidylarginine deiminase
MLKNAIDAKAAKIDKKLKMIELQLKKQKLDNDSIQEDNSVSIPGDGFIVADRNSLLEKLRNMK